MRIRLWWATPAAVMFLTMAVAPIATARADASSADDKAPPVTNRVNLEIQISGLGQQGAKIEVKPAHPDCKFNVVGITIPKGDRGDVVKITPFAVNATTTNPDRDCSFEITVTEAGQKPKTFRRGLRLTAPAAQGAEAPISTLRCYLPATTLAAKDTAKTRR